MSSHDGVGRANERPRWRSQAYIGVPGGQLLLTRQCLFWMHRKRPLPWLIVLGVSPAGKWRSSIGYMFEASWMHSVFKIGLARKFIFARGSEGKTNLMEYKQHLLIFSIWPSHCLRLTYNRTTVPARVDANFRPAMTLDVYKREKDIAMLILAYWYPCFLQRFCSV